MKREEKELQFSAGLCGLPALLPALSPAPLELTLSHVWTNPGGRAQKDLGWKRSSMSSSPAINPAPLSVSRISRATPGVNSPRDGDSSPSLSCWMSSPALAPGGRCWAQGGSVGLGAHRNQPTDLWKCISNSAKPV